MASQICVKCDTDKPLSEYYKRSNGKGIYKYNSDCKACKKLYDRERYIKLGGKRNAGKYQELNEKFNREYRERCLKNNSNSDDVHWSLI
jgi:hypothetical protein